MTWDVILHTLSPFGVRFAENASFHIGTRLLLLTQEAQDCADTVYITAGAQAREFHRALVVCVGEDAVTADNCIVVAEQDLFRVFNALMDTKCWLDGLDRALAACDSDQEIVDCASRYTGLPMFYLDETYRILAITDTAIGGDAEWKHMSEQRYLSPASARKMRESGDLDFLAPSMVPVVYRSEIYPFDAVVCNLWQEGKFVSRLNVLCVDTEATPRLCRASELIAIHLKRLITKNHSLSAGSPVQRILLDLLHGTPLPEEMIQEFLKSTLVPADSLFQLFCVDMEAQEDLQVAAYYASLLRQQFSAAPLIPVELNEHLVLLIYGKDEAALDALAIQLDHFVVTHRLRCGASNPFHRLSTLQGYFRQGLAALDMGDKEGMRFYRDIMLEHMLSYIPREQAPFLISPDIARLQAAQADFSFSLLETLRVYLACNCNLNRAAECLFLHKNTLLYRMNHIRSIVRCDWNGPDQRLLLMLSFKLLDRK